MSRALIVEFVIILPLLLVSLAVHELAHAWVADASGDPTPRRAGRLTLNPIAHLDLWGTAMLIVTFIASGGGFFFGWARPVPVDPWLLRGRRAQSLVAAAGPAANLVLAVAAALLCRVVAPWSLLAGETIALAFYLNMTLALLNALPIPPLDGWQVVAGLLPAQGRRLVQRLAPYEQYVFLGFVALIVLAPGVLGAIFGPPILGAADLLLPTQVR